MTGLALLALGLLGAAAAWELHRIRQQERWRTTTEARLAVYQERAARSNGHPRTGQVTHLGPHH
jgi:hypothetical protein